MRTEIIILSAALVLAASCSREDSPAAPSSDEITFSLAGDGMDFDVETKAVTPVTSLSSVYWEALSGSTVKHAVKSYTVSSGSVSTGLYWPSTSATYTYRAANFAFATSTGSCTLENTADHVCGTLEGVTKSTAAKITLDHVFARTGTLTLNTQSGYTLSDVTWKIKSSAADAASGTKGVYTVGTGWGSTATTSLAEQTFTSSSDLYLIPGTYTVTVSYKLTKGDYTVSLTRSADVTLTKGCVNAITGTAVGASASGITFSVDITKWGSATQTLNIK